jgi:deoxyribodipyrimidine photolyase-related protein
MPKLKKVDERLAIVLGDQLDLESTAIQRLDRQRDRIWMAEACEESTHVWSSKLRIACFLSAMRHYRDELLARGYEVIYHRLDPNQPESLAGILASDLKRFRPRQVQMVRAGDYRVHRSLERAVTGSGSRFTCLPDNHFYCDQACFDQWADQRKQLRLEYFYRFLRKRHHILMTDGRPTGGSWNYDRDNRKVFSGRGPGITPPWPAYQPDRLTRDVISDVEECFSEHPGDLAGLDWPLTRRDALHALDDFVEYRLATFGPYQDAMWTDEPFLYHSGLAAAMNLKLLNPREVIDAAIEAWDGKGAPLASVEGFVRQILGWREYVHGIYWRYMPEYIDRNVLQAGNDLPRFYWNGDTDMQCLRQVLHQTFKYGYAHHIQRLMVTGLFALLFGVRPRQVHEWYLSVYVDAVEWVELPNTLGMSQYADGGLLASKPYVASGRYIERMSNYCKNCRYDPGKAVGETACPFTTLYWDFLQRHETSFRTHPRTALQWRNLDRLSEADKRDIRSRADSVRRLYR